MVSIPDVAPSETAERDERRSKEHTPLQRYFLSRLEHLHALRLASRTEVLLDDEDQRLIGLAMYGAWRDCVDEGVGDVASRLVGVPAPGANRTTSTA